MRQMFYPGGWTYRPPRDLEKSELEQVTRMVERTKGSQANQKGWGMKVYISGPMTGHRDSRERFGGISYLLKKEGHGAVNPVQIMEPVHGVLDDNTILNADLELLEGCDAIIMLPGWEDSKGARKEYDKANRLGLKTFYTESIGRLPDELRRPTDTEDGQE